MCSCVNSCNKARTKTTATASSDNRHRHTYTHERTHGRRGEKAGWCYTVSKKKASCLNITLNFSSYIQISINLADRFSDECLTTWFQNQNQKQRPTWENAYRQDIVTRICCSNKQRKQGRNLCIIGDAMLPQTGTKLTEKRGSKFGAVLCRHLTPQRKTET